MFVSLAAFFNSTLYLTFPPVVSGLASVTTFMDGNLPGKILDTVGFPFYAATRYLETEIGLPTGLGLMTIVVSTFVFLTLPYRLIPSRWIRLKYSYNLIIGVFFSFVCHRWAAFHLVISSFLVFLILAIFCRSRRLSCVLTIVTVSLHLFTLLSYDHWMRPYRLQSEYVLAFMFLGLKLIALSFNLLDGSRVPLPKDDLRTFPFYSSLDSRRCEEFALRHVPNCLPYFSYVFHFPTVLMGPIVEFKTYMRYIQLSDTFQGNFSPVAIAFRGILGLSFLGLFLVASFFGLSSSTFKERLDQGEPWYVVFGFSFLCLFQFRCGLHCVWLMMETCCVAAGYGYEARDSNVWRNVRATSHWQFELAGNVRNMVLEWNVSTALFFRRYVFDRIPDQAGYFVKMIVPMIVAAYWHGFWIGYVMMWVSMGFLVLLNVMWYKKVIRRLWPKKTREEDVGNGVWSILIGVAVRVVGIVVSQIAICYFCCIFMILGWDPICRYYSRLYWMGHVFVLGAMAVLSAIPRK